MFSEKVGLFGQIVLRPGLGPEEGSYSMTNILYNYKIDKC